MATKSMWRWHEMHYDGLGNFIASWQVPLPQRFWDQVQENPATGCWEWTGYTYKGYGFFGHAGQWWGAHRWAWHEHCGEIPRGLQLDHLCRVRNCVNPDHLEPVTPLVNTRRGIAARAADRSAS